MESIHTDKPTYYVCEQRLTQFEKISHQFTFFWMRKFVFLTRSKLWTVETDRASLSWIVMQAPKNVSDAFFCFGQGETCFFAFFALQSIWERFTGYVQQELW